MRRATGLLIAFSLSATLLLCACDDEYTPGEGARRYGWVEDDSQNTAKTPGKAITVAKVADVGAAPTSTPKESTAGKAPNAPVKPARGGRRGPTGGNKSYSVLDGGVTDGGTIAGTVKLAAGDAGLKEIELQKEVDQAQCKHKAHASERLVFDTETRGLQNCVVMLTDITKGKAWSDDMGKKKSEREAVLDQVECKYVPHVLVAREDSQLVVKNSDPAEHNIHGYYKSLQQTEFNFFTPVGAPPTKASAAKLKKKGLWLVRCDIHPWMNATLHIVDTPYFAVTDAKGKYEIKDVPAGTYTVTIWHGSLKEEAQIVASKITGYSYGPDWTLSQKIEVKAGETATVDCERPIK